MFYFWRALSSSFSWFIYSTKNRKKCFFRPPRVIYFRRSEILTTFFNATTLSTRSLIKNGKRKSSRSIFSIVSIFICLAVTSPSARLNVTTLCKWTINDIKEFFFCNKTQKEMAPGSPLICFCLHFIFFFGFFANLNKFL